MSTDNLDELLKLTPQQNRKWTDKAKRRLCEVVSTFQPEFKKLMTRNLHSGEGFPEDLDILARLATHAAETHPEIYKAIRLKQIESCQMIGMQWDNSYEYGVPLSRIDPSTFRLILDCQAPIHTPLWTEQTTPRFPTQFYILPKGMLEVENEPIILLGITCWTPDQLKEAETELCNRIQLNVINSKVEKGMFFVAAYTNGRGEYYTRQPIIDGVIQESKKFVDHSEMGASTAEMEFSEKLLSIGMQLLLLENTYPEWHTPEKELKTITGGGRQLREFRPKLIGGNFPHRNKFTISNQSQSGEDDRKRPCEHWRGAHWKTVHYGAKNSLSKRKLILPYLVNPGFD